MRIYLVGYMGSGKSTVGKKLAAKLGFRFVDLDTEVEKKYGKPIPDLFAIEGENSFREMERTCLRKTINYDDTVIATGGGTSCFFDNIDWMNSNGITVYLEVNVDTLYSRLIASAKERPLITNLFGKELKEYIATNLQKRVYFYKQCRYIIEGKDLQVNGLLKILNQIR